VNQQVTTFANWRRDNVWLLKAK